ncbi:hypothetical protein ACFIQF_13175 [Comamonas sp. J-3]|uniref:hypothetical protein n=1 Tax=Comamonas trifloxystrobinivorans TaxID=3350256 RepID=UPI003728EA1A
MIEESYQRAVHSSHLGMAAHRIGDADTLAAYATVNKKRSVSANDAMRLRAEFDGSAVNPSQPDKLIASIALKSYGSARMLLELRCMKLGIKDSKELVSRVLDHWLNRRCGKCKGVGKVETDAQIYTCSKCKGLKFRRDPDDEQARELLNYLDRACGVTNSLAKKQLFADAV